MRFKLTPKALANLSPGFEPSENPGLIKESAGPTLKGFAKRLTLSGFIHNLLFIPHGCRCAPTMGSN